MNSMIKCVQSSESQVQWGCDPLDPPGAVIPAESLLALSRRFIIKGWFVRTFFAAERRAYPITLDLADNFIGAGLSRAEDARAFDIQHRAAAGFVPGVPVIRYAGDTSAPAANAAHGPYGPFSDSSSVHLLSDLATQCLWDASSRRFATKTASGVYCKASGSRSLSL